MATTLIVSVTIQVDSLRVGHGDHAHRQRYNTSWQRQINHGGHADRQRYNTSWQRQINHGDHADRQRYNTS